MASKPDTKAARERKQKIFVAIGAVLFVGLAVIQGPKLMNQLKGKEAAPVQPAAASTPAPSAAGAPTSSGGTVVVASPQTVRAPKGARTQLAGVLIVPEQPAKAGDGQLQSFTLFVKKDPFVQQVKTDKLLTPAEVAALGGGKPTKPQQQTESGSSSGSGSASTGGLGATPSNPSVPLTLAILKVNGKTQTIELGKKFPKGDGSFLLKNLKKGRAGIAVAGGDFAGGGVLTLPVGKQITLVNTATGAQYVVKLLYVGDESHVTRFSSK